MLQACCRQPVVTTCYCTCRRYHTCWDLANNSQTRPDIGLMDRQLLQLAYLYNNYLRVFIQGTQKLFSECTSLTTDERASFRLLTRNSQNHPITQVVQHTFPNIVTVTFSWALRYSSSWLALTLPDSTQLAWWFIARETLANLTRNI